MSARAKSNEHRVLVIVPTYNERENLPLITARLFAANPDVDLLVVDDGSPDGTGELADGLAADDERVHVLHRTAKNGLGAAYIAGFGWGLERDYDALVEMDADGSHAPEQLPRLLTALFDGVPTGRGARTGPADVVLGSRWVRGGTVQNWPLHRKLISVGGNVYTQLALGVRLRDATGGYRAYRREVLQKLDLATVASQGYCFQVDLVWRAIQAGFTVVEVPITFVERVHGQSKMSQDIVREAFGRVTVWGVSRRRHQLARTLARIRGGRRS